MSRQHLARSWIVAGTSLCVAACGSAGTDPGEGEGIGRVQQAACSAEPDFVCSPFFNPYSDNCNWSAWPNGLVKYELEGDWTNPTDQAFIAGLLAEWESVTGGRIYFVYNSVAPDRLKIRKGSCDITGVGYSPSGQTLWVDPNGAWCSKHDMGHILGFSHEHQRTDRDRYLTFVSSVLEWWDGDCSKAWQMCPAPHNIDYGVFNSGSIMMYESYDSGDGDRFQWHRDDCSDIT